MALKKNSICPICGEGTLKLKVMDEEFKYKGRRFVVKDYEAMECDRCGEGVLDSRLMRKNEAKIKDHHRQIEGLLTSEEIKKIRRSLKMTQRQMADLLGGGIRSFSKYERGEIIQSKPMDNLLRMLRNHSQLVAYLKELKRERQSA